MKSKKASPRVLELESQVLELSQKLEHLQKVNLDTMESLDMLLGLGDFLPAINRLASPEPIIKETLRQVGLLVPCLARGICIVDEKDGDFILNQVEPAQLRPQLAGEMNALIYQGVFNWALRENRAVTVPGIETTDRIVLHALATSSRIRGMFIGIVAPEVDVIPDVRWSIFSIMLKFCAGNLESYELYRILRDSNLRLERQISKQP
ncbi:BTB/POZ domain-containing protein [Desulfonatronum parangueonense]